MRPPGVPRGPPVPSGLSLRGPFASLSGASQSLPAYTRESSAAELTTDSIPVAEPGGILPPGQNLASLIGVLSALSQTGGHLACSLHPHRFPTLAHRRHRPLTAVALLCFLAGQHSVRPRCRPGAWHGACRSQDTRAPTGDDAPWRRARNRGKTMPAQCRMSVVSKNTWCSASHSWQRRFATR